MAKRKQNPSTNTSNNNNRKVASKKKHTTTTAEETFPKMFKKKKNGIADMFQSLAEDPNDPNSVINMEGTLIIIGKNTAC